MISCRDVTKLITSDQVLYESWLKRLEVKVHLLMCRHCSRVVRQVESLRKSARELWEVSDQPDPGNGGDELESRVLHKLLKK